MREFVCLYLFCGLEILCGFLGFCELFLTDFKLFNGFSHFSEFVLCGLKLLCGISEFVFSNLNLLMCLIKFFVWWFGAAFENL